MGWFFCWALRLSVQPIRKPGDLECGNQFGGWIRDADVFFVWPAVLLIHDEQTARFAIKATWLRDDIGYMVVGLRNCDSCCSASQWSSPQNCIIKTKAISLPWSHANILNKGIACSYSQDTESMQWSSYGQPAPLWVEALIIKSQHAVRYGGL